VGVGRDLRKQQFFGSRTRVHRTSLSDEVARRLTDSLGLDSGSFIEEPEDPESGADSIFLLRHTLMNPWLSGSDHGMNYLDRYCRHLADLVRHDLKD